MRSQPTTIVRWASLTCSIDWATTTRPAGTSLPDTRIPVPSIGAVNGLVTLLSSTGKPGGLRAGDDSAVLGDEPDQERSGHGAVRVAAGRGGVALAPSVRRGEPVRRHALERLGQPASMSAVSVTVAKATTAAPIRR